MPTQARPGERPAAEDVETEHANRMTVNLLAAILCLLLLGAGLFVVEGLDRAYKIQNCFEAGRRVCVTPGLKPERAPPHWRG